MYIKDFEDPEIELSIKVVIVGNGGVGKSSMIQRYCRGTFTRNYRKTIGVDFLEKELRVQGENVRLMMWDTAGQEEFDSITRSYYRGAQACVIAFSTTDLDSMLAVRKWKKKVEDECGYIPMVLVQNKIDLIQEAQFNMQDVEKFSAGLGLRLYKVSVKEDLNVGSVFQHLAENFVHKVKDYERFPRQMKIGGFDMGGGGGGGDVSREGILVLGGERKGKRVKFLNSDPCIEYLSNPIFESLHHHRKFRHNKKGFTKSSCRNL